MKNLIRICSLLTLVVVFSVVSAKAQTVNRFEAKIPFAFSIGEKSYDAGTYTMRLADAPVGKVMTLFSDQNEILQRFYVMERGDAPTRSSLMRFTGGNNGYALAKILTPEKSFSVAVSKSAKKSGSATFGAQTVSINLK